MEGNVLFLIGTLFSDFYFLTFLILGGLIGPLNYYLNNGFPSFNQEIRVPYWTPEVALSTVVFVGIGLLISLPQINPKVYEAIPEMGCVSKHYNSEKMIEAFKKREDKTLRWVEYRALSSELSSCMRENRIEKALSVGFSEEVSVVSQR